ncbi:MAG: hypothetical protein EU539_05685 [Promethearchaeota archaeon]|nr:MAG: hypothetical protein EU539_05685 [Candidatus Lokiarchaeota archaeon]
MEVQDLFNKIYHRICDVEVPHLASTKAFVLFTKGGIPLTSSTATDVLHGGLFSAITNFARESFQRELNHFKIGNHVYLFKRTEHLLGSLVIESNDELDPKFIKVGLHELLEYLERNCPEFQTEIYDSKKIEELIIQYMNSLL